MNYYPFHLGDYAASTQHLEPMEDLAYRRMLDSYYLRECALPVDVAEVARLIRMRQHLAEVEAVLREFFELGETGWSHARCDEEIERMLDKQAKARAAAGASVIARRTNAQRTLSGRSTDVELPTPTPTPNKEEARKRAVLPKPDGVTDSVWEGFLAIRKAKRAPLSAAALEGIEREAAKAGITLGDALAMCCARGWQGFKAEWADQPERKEAEQKDYDI